MEITDKLRKGIPLDLTKPLTDEIKEAFHMLLGNNADYVFHYERDSWVYWNGCDGEFQKEHVRKSDYTKLEAQNRMISVYKKRYKSYVEVESEDDSFLNIGSQVVSCEDGKKLYIRVILFGIYFDEIMELKIGNNAYYIVYDLIEKRVELGFTDIFDIAPIISKEEKNNCLTYPFSQEETYDYEDMDFGYDFGFIPDPSNMIYEILNNYEPKISCWPFSYSVLEEIHMIKRQIECPIYANPEARERIKSFKSYSLEDFESLGLFPQEYELYQFLGISNYPDEEIILENIKSIRKWEAAIEDNNLSELIRYYTEIREISIKSIDIEFFLDIFDISKGSLLKILPFILNGVAEEGLELWQTLKNVKYLVESGQINSWKGRYSKRLMQKSNMRNTTKINRETLDLLEQKPTLDNLYKQLSLLKEA